MIHARMATNVLFPLSSSSAGRNGVTLNGNSAPRTRQISMKDSGLSAAASPPADLSVYAGSVTRRGKGEEVTRVHQKHKAVKKSVAQQIDPSR